MMEKETVLTPSEERKAKFQFANQEKDLHDTKFETKPVSYLHDCMRRFVKNKASVVGGIIILIIALFAIFEPMVDSKNHVSELDYPSGFADKNFDCVLPKLFVNTGFWDGTKKEVLGETDYKIYQYDDSNHQRIELLDMTESSIKIGSNIIKTKHYTVRWDTYAVGTKRVNLSASQYEALVQYEKDAGIYHTEKSIMKPMIHYSSSDGGYLATLQQQIYEEYVESGMQPGNAASTVNGIIDQMTNYYQQNANIYYQLIPTKTNGLYSDVQFNPVLDDEGNPIDIYRRDENGDPVYYEMYNSRYDVRVDYYDYFTYVNGFEPKFLFGTNQYGQDICLRLAKGARFSLLLGAGITLINFILGLIYGAVSGYYGGRVDLIMERITDIISNIPTIIIMTIAQIQLTSNTELKAVIGGTGTLILAILIAYIYNGWVGVASTTRMQFYRFKGQEYVLASRTLGAKDRRLIFKHILPNAAGTLVTSCVLMIPSVIFSESSLSYLGIINFSTSGICSIGALLSEGQLAGISSYPHVLLFPALVISLLMISFNLFGNGLRDAFNTTLRGSED